jgi:pimeloyl-ACP methyl ester carboxylesterase
VGWDTDPGLIEPPVPLSDYGRDEFANAIEELANERGVEFLRDLAVEVREVESPARDPLRFWAPAACAAYQEYRGDTSSSLEWADRGILQWDRENAGSSVSGAISDSRETLLAFRSPDDPPSTLTVLYSPDQPDDLWADSDWEPWLHYSVHVSQSDDRPSLLIAGESPLVSPTFELPFVAGESLAVFHLFQRRVERRISWRRDNLLTDRFMKMRQEEFRRKAGSLVQDAVDLRELVEWDGRDRAPIFVHGTASTGYAYLDQLVGCFGRRRLLLFEHDTFQVIRWNVRDLVQLVHDKLDGIPLLLIGHSRGGLVALMTASHLIRQGQDVETLTFGSPFQGTPLADTAELLLRFGPRRDILSDAIRLLQCIKGDSASKELASLLLEGDGQLPEGWTDMRPDSATVRDLTRFSAPPVFVSCGSSIQPHPFRHPMRDALASYLAAWGPNDGVVHESSATALGAQGPQGLHCRHSDYFIEVAVRDELSHAI